MLLAARLSAVDGMRQERDPVLAPPTGIVWLHGDFRTFTLIGVAAVKGGRRKRKDQHASGGGHGTTAGAGAA